MKRLQKFISECGVASRRKAEDLIAQGKVAVNGTAVTEMGYKINENDVVTVDGKTISPQKKIYIMLNKPKGYITAVSDDRGRKTVVDLITDIDEKLFPVGRLDYDTEGLLVLTSDGDFANKVIHPSENKTKTYIATLDRNLKNDEIEALLTGVQIEDYIAVATELKMIDKSSRAYLMKIITGKNRQVRKMFEAVNSKVKTLKRISIGKLNLGNLMVGEYRHLTETEIKELIEWICFFDNFTTVFCGK